MATKLFITDNPQVLAESKMFEPRAVVSRAGVEKLQHDMFVDVGLDGTDVEILNQFKNAQKWYLPDGLDFDPDIDIMNEAFVTRRQEYIAPVFKKLETELITGDTLPSLSPDHIPDDGFDAEKKRTMPIDQQIAIMQKILANRKIGAGTIAELTATVSTLCKENGIFVRDTVTGLYRSILSYEPLISEYEASNMFRLHFMDQLVIKTTTYKVDKDTGNLEPVARCKKITREELGVLWNMVSAQSTFNSRKEYYDNIPEWDSEERIGTFMKKYFECDTNPNFFLLLMTALVAKFSPRNDYCPYFFDIVAKSKGIGKSWLCTRLLGPKYCGFLTFAVGRRDDFFVNAYDGNNAIVVDDECTWISTTKQIGKISHDEMKTLVTTATDKFSRKMQQPEEHDRSFIIIRTSNEVHQVYSPDERRQIIFECHLPAQECRIKDLSDDFFRQMLAEAKVYYKKHHGIYQLTDDDKLEVRSTNLDNYNYETKENYAILDYVKAVRADEGKWGAQLKAKKFGVDKWGSHEKYVDWCDTNRKPSLPSRAFWRSVEALADVPENYITVISDKRYDMQYGGRARVFRIDPVGLTPDEQAIMDLEDIPA